MAGIARYAGVLWSKIAAITAAYIIQLLEPRDQHCYVLQENLYPSPLNSQLFGFITRLDCLTTHWVRLCACARHS